MVLSARWDLSTVSPHLNTKIHKSNESHCLLKIAYITTSEEQKNRSRQLWFTGARRKPVQSSVPFKEAQSHKAAAGLAHWLRSSTADATASSASAKSSSPSCCHERAGDKLHAGILRMEPSQLGKGWEGTPLIRYSGCWQT